MSADGTLLARHYTTGDGLRVTWRNGRIAAVEPAAAPAECWIAPGLTDLQVNGYGTVDFRDPALTADALRTAVRALHRDGCVAVFPTLTTNDWALTLAQLRRMRAWRAACPELTAGIAGWHLEGPFLSPAPGYCGAHPPDCMISPSPAHIRALREAAGADPVLLTVAPEQAGVLDVIPQAVALGMRVSLGHSNAAADQIAAAVRAGATAFTHLGNGCPQALDRHDNILWRVIEAGALRPGLIPDGIHVSPALFRILHRALDPARLWYTTDAVHPAGAPPGRYRMWDMEVEVGPDQVVRRPGATNFAGSALRPLEGVFRAADMLGCAWRAVWDRYARHPRALMGLDLAWLAPGGPASFCLLDFTAPNAPTARTYVAGTPRGRLPARGRMGGAGLADGSA